MTQLEGVRLKKFQKLIKYGVPSLCVHSATFGFKNQDYCSLNFKGGSDENCCGKVVWPGTNKLLSSKVKVHAFVILKSQV